MPTPARTAERNNLMEGDRERSGNFCRIQWALGLMGDLLSMEDRAEASKNLQLANFI